MHARFPEPALVKLPNGKWLLLKEYEVPATVANPPFVIPQGFETDGASSLGLFIEPWGGHYPIATLAHDYLYHRLNIDKPLPFARSRKEADKIFRTLCKASGVRPLVRFGMWLAVRAFGGPTLKRLFVQ